MTQHGAHVTQTLQPKPSIFDGVTADQLQSTFYPALRLIVNYLAYLKPHLFGWMLWYFDEIFLCLHGLLQHHYLRAYGATFSENFFDLTRVNSSTNKLSSTDKSVAFACVVFLPYVAGKLKVFRQQASDEEILAGVAIALVQLAYAILQLYHLIAYMVGRSKAHSLVNCVIGQHLIYLPSDATVQWTWVDLLQHAFILGYVVFSSVKLSAFFLQYLKWW